MDILELELDQEVDLNPAPQGELTLQVVALPKDTNQDNDILGGWVVSQMDLAAEITARKIADGRVATVAIHQLTFIRPIEVGDIVCCYTNVTSLGGSSIHIDVEVWVKPAADPQFHKVTEGTFVFVAIDSNRRTRRIKQP